MRPDSTDTPRVLIFPPLLFGGTLLVGLLLHWLHPIPLMPALPARILGVVIFILSGVFGYLAQRELDRASTNVRPDRPTTAIVMEGPYRITRNPLYIAVLGIYIGVAIFANAVVPLILLIPVFAVLQWGIVLREERYLESKFGNVYRAYRSRVRRWL
jgi:protein-S-isoprenylcysteine O-methyltransferase Ste14